LLSALPVDAGIRGIDIHARPLPEGIQRPFVLSSLSFQFCIIQLSVRPRSRPATICCWNFKAIAHMLIGMNTIAIVTVIFERREDGGLSVSSPDVPGFILSHREADLVLADVQPALETILSERLYRKVTVRPLKGIREVLIDGGIISNESFAPLTHAHEKRQLVICAA
jgi:hypothetical protein